MKIAGTEIRDDKHVVISLRGIFGIGKTTAIKILEKVNIPPSKKVKELTDAEQQSLVDELDNYTITNDLKRKILNNINRLVTIRCYKGLRLQKGLPARGQRTHTNSKTARRNSVFGGRKTTTKNIKKNSQNK